MSTYFSYTCLLVLLLLQGCTTSSLTSEIVPGETLDNLGKIYIARFEPDRRNLNTIIADKLTLMGYPATPGESDNIPNDTNTLVTYVDNWYWDITNYMLRINIQFRDANTRILKASGESYRTSLVRRSPEEMIEETLLEIFGNQ